MSNTTSGSAAFWIGLTCSSPRLFLSAVLLAGLLVACLELTLARGWLWRLDVQWLLSTPFDDWTHAMWVVNQPTGDDVDVSVYLIGGSGSREALIDNESVTHGLNQNSTRRYSFLNLGTRNQTLFESVLLIDNLPDVNDGLIIIGLTPYFFRDSVKDAREAVHGTRMPLYSATLVDFLKSANVIDDKALNSNLLRFRRLISHYLHQRAGTGSLFTPHTYQYHIYDDQRPMSDTQLGQTIARISQDMRDFPRNAPLNFFALETATLLARSKGYRVVLVDMPRNPVAEPFLYARHLPLYKTNMQTLSQSIGVEHLDLHSQFGFPREYFYDHIHLTRHSRPEFQRRFIQLVQSRMEKP